MTLPRTDTIVTFPAGATTGTARALHVAPHGDAHIVLLDTTPVHPMDAAWPDQGPDRATLAWEGGHASVDDCVVAATDGESLHVGADIPARKGTPGWAFVVAHVVAEAPEPGTEVTVTVDAEHRHALSVGHTACHLASLALNRAMADRWRKEVRADALDTPDFDGAANAVSLIEAFGSTDTYRLGKSLRKRGFTVEGLAEDLPAIEKSVNDQLDAWVATGAPVRIDRDGETLTDRRVWVADLPDGEASIPCGGTHVRSLAELGDVRASLTLAEADGALELTMLLSSFRS